MQGEDAVPHSAAEIIGLVTTVSIVIGMSASMGDVDAITYAARFYAAITDDQSVQAAHQSLIDGIHPHGRALPYGAGSRIQVT
ncbi:hypothetical protein [Streptomyces sp. NPDC001269]